MSRTEAEAEMRWDGLFADLEAQAAALDQATRAAEVDERTRGEIGTLSVSDRLRAAVGSTVRLQCAGGVVASGLLLRVGPDWVLIDEGGGHEVVVAGWAVLTVRGLRRDVVVPGSVGVVESRLGLRHALRGIARDRSGVRVYLLDGSTLEGTIDRVGADFIEVAVHPAGEPRRRRDVREIELVPLRAVTAVRRSL
jgi:hypothetical protein